LSVARGLDDILASFSHLVQQHDQSADDSGADRGGNFRCVACEGCDSCRFCTACVDCDDCNYCDACVQCHSCTQSRQCHGCVEVSHSSFSAGCQRSSYLVLCYDCEDCVHCFACAGLSGEEFCVLNERYPRKEYFALVSQLRAELDVRSTEGWQPPWSEVEELEEEDHPVVLEPSKVATFDDDWLAALDEPPPSPAPAVVEQPEAPAPPRELVRPPPPGVSGNEEPARARVDDKPTRPYPVVEPAAVQGPSLRAARRPARRSVSKG
jgi:hypothetical protein